MTFLAIVAALVTFAFTQHRRRARLSSPSNRAFGTNKLRRRHPCQLQHLVGGLRARLIAVGFRFPLGLAAVSPGLGLFVVTLLKVGLVDFRGCQLPAGEASPPWVWARSSIIVSVVYAKLAPILLKGERGTDLT